MDRTPNLDMPFILPSQAQKHVTHNEALWNLDALVQLSVLDRDLSTPPASPSEGDRYIVAASGTDDWTGHDGEIAILADGAWTFHTPGEGWTVWVADEDLLLVFDGALWSGFDASISILQNLSLLGVGTTADETNPFSARLNNALFTALYAGDGGDGDLRLKANKETEPDTVSYLFQTGYSGRAEFGLIGNDDFTIKVSDDGATWNDAIVIDKSTGEVSMPHTTFAGAGDFMADGSVAMTGDLDLGGNAIINIGNIREPLTAARTYYVDPSSGSDSNDGLSAGTAFATIQHAYNTIAGKLDLNGYATTIQLLDGTYTAGMSTSGPWTGGGSVTLKGNSSTPANTLISTSGPCLTLNTNLPGNFTFKDLKLSSSASHAVLADGIGTVLFSNVDFGSAAVSHISIESAGQVFKAIGNYTISGGASSHISINYNGYGSLGHLLTITLTGTPAFGTFARVNGGAVLLASSTTFSGSATGARYYAALNGVIYTVGGGAAFFPGSSAGSTATGGQYA